MANTYTQIYIHVVFSPRHREALIKYEWSGKLERYITGIVQNNGHKMLAIKAMPDHIHIFIGYNPTQTIPKLVEEIKTSSNSMININNLSKFKFDWQRGYGAFSHSRSKIDTVVKYVLNQEKHHKKLSFKDEYLEILKKNDIKYNDKYLFDFLD